MTTPNIKTEYFTPLAGANSVTTTSTVIAVLMVYRQIALSPSDYSKSGNTFTFNNAFGQTSGAQATSENIAITYTY